MTMRFAQLVDAHSLSARIITKRILTKKRPGRLASVSLAPLMKCRLPAAAARRCSRTRLMNSKRLSKRENATGLVHLSSLTL